MQTLYRYSLDSLAALLCPIANAPFHKERTGLVTQWEPHADGLAEFSPIVQPEKI